MKHPRKGLGAITGWWTRTWRRWRTAHRCSRGFTLTELAVTMVLSTIVSMAAFHIHATFSGSLHRQDEISRIQGTMKIARSMLEQRIRPAGSGMIGVVSSDCGGTHQVGPFTIHNSNVIGTSDTTLGGTDNDPDWFEVISADMSRSSYINGQSPVKGVTKPVDDPTLFKVGGLMGLRNKNGICIFMITHAMANAGRIQYNPGGGGPLDGLNTCYNGIADRKDCEENVMLDKFMNTGDQIVDMSTGSFALRIDNSRPARPVLMMASGMAGGDPTLYQWKPVAVNVEDMQIALHLDTSVPPDGMGDLWINSRDQTTDELMAVRAVRISIVFRSNTEVSGWRSGRRPALEDRPVQATTDGYIRRVMTTVIKLRNRPEPRPPSP
jgi:prepilin-type N-terminal cleavage/methylation domain-containing protein